MRSIPDLYSFGDGDGADKRLKKADISQTNRSIVILLTLKAQCFIQECRYEHVEHEKLPKPRAATHSIGLRF